MATKKIKITNLPKLFEDLKKSGKTIIAPKQKGAKVYFAPVEHFDQVAPSYIQTVLSAKSVAFPRVEELFRYEIKEKEIIQKDNYTKIPEIVIFGLRPCDAASFEYMKEFFLKENPDVHFKKRMDNATLITVSCSESDESCFCTSVGLSPSSTKGSDIVLTNIGNGNMYVEVLTEKGDNIINANTSLFEESETIDKEPFVAKLTSRFDLNTVLEKIQTSYDNPEWQKNSYACIGCGACAFSCPTCSCFDIQDEQRENGGVRLRLWDTCGQQLFTVHASGHNPRHVQSQRWKHRILHKFKYSVDNLDMVSCVGCGRCIRVCPADMNIIEQIVNLVEV